MKKILALLLALVMVLSLCACGAKEEAPAATEAPVVEEVPDAAELVSDAFIDPVNGWEVYDELIAQIKDAGICDGDQTAFVRMMNEKAKEIGCTSTNFTNPHGLHDENQYTTAKDMFLIAQEARFNMFPVKNRLPRRT